MPASSPPDNPLPDSDEGLSIGYRTDTIVARATPPGPGGVAVVRLSGPEALKMALKLCKSPLKDHPRHAFLTELRTPEGQLLDQALVTWFAAPASFTGEGVVEFSTHGGSVTPGRVVTALMELGARPAEPGEFSLRAFLNGKLDLAEAEALNQLVGSLSRRGQEAASANLSGRLSREIGRIRETLLHLMTILEHELDFSEEEIEPTSQGEIAATLDLSLEELHRLRATGPYGRLIRDGVRVVLAGRPNSGKSSLFNALLGKEQALVTDLPGTTRDSLEGWVQIAGFPVCLVDTAGLHDTGDVLDRLGVGRSREQLARADIILFLDPEEPPAEAVDEIGEYLRKTVIYVKTKVDRPPQSDRPDKVIPTSIYRDDGLDLIHEGLKQALNDYVPLGESAIITSDRQLKSLEGAHKRLAEARELVQRGLPTDIISAEIRLVIDRLADIIGETTSEEVIHRIFSEFCIGK